MLQGMKRYLFILLTLSPPLASEYRGEVIKLYSLRLL